VAFWYRRTLLTQDTWAYRALETAEESLEMLAIVLMIYTVLDYAAKSFQTALFGFRVQFAQRHDALATASAPKNPDQASAGEFQIEGHLARQAAHQSQ
jgi:membrane glycosyltransferase